MPCSHFTILSAAHGACSKGLYGGAPSHGVCLQCESNTDPAWHKAQIEANQKAEAAISRIVIAQPSIPSSGIGDALEAILARWGFQKTAGCNCNSLKARLNSLTVAKATALRDSLTAQLVANYHPPAMLRYPVLVVAKALVRRAISKARQSHK